MKTIKLTILLLFFPLAFYAQSLTGLWVGTVSNDSTTVRKEQAFEMVLTHYKNKVYGYSRSTFIVNDTLYYIVKRVKGTIEGNVCEVKDDEIVSYNFRGRIDKGVKMISTFRFDNQDSMWHMDGTWKTNQTKKYYSLSGKMDLKTEPDPEKSKIFPHLEELKLADDVAFYKESKKVTEPVAEPVAVIKQPVIDKKKEGPAIASAKEIKKEEVVKIPVKSTPVAEVKPIVETKPVTTIAVEKPKEEKTEPVAVIKPPVNEIRKEPVVKEEKTPVVVVKEVKKEEQKTTAPQSEQVLAVKPLVPKEQVITPATNAAAKNTGETTIVIAKEKQQPVTNLAEVKPALPQAATFVAERKVAGTQTVFFRSDSLQLSLYDNGEVDGDTVSVLLNGELIIAKQGLKVSAIKKTIYVPAGQTDSLTLVLYAENLGKYPPNTGLLVVHDGDDVYQVRFSADLQQNAAIIFKRKRN
ncbi:MAG TPA: hypothetical protein VIZ28_10680 [Chitinophagaceae bacterium]